MKEADQPLVHVMLSDMGLYRAMPDDERSLWPRPVSLSHTERMESLSTTLYYERCRQGARIWETPSRPFLPRSFVIIYCAETVGLASVPSKRDEPQDTRFVSLSTLPKPGFFTNEVPNCLVPTFQSLVESEMHVLLVNSVPQTTHVGSAYEATIGSCSNASLSGGYGRSIRYCFSAI